MKKINVGILGATGAVGTEFLKLMSERKFPVGDLKLFASDASVGKVITYSGQPYRVEKLSAQAFAGLELLFVAGGDDLSREFSPMAMQAGAYVVDNSAAFRMDPNFALVVPEVNGALLKKMSTPTIIANPNCSTIQLVLALEALKGTGQLTSVKVATYQSVSGAGTPGIQELERAREASVKGTQFQKDTFPHPILENCLPQIGSFNEQGLTSEEEKVRKETKKILNLPNLAVSVFAVRVPVKCSHSEAVWVEFEKPVNTANVMEAFKNFPGLCLIENWKGSEYPLAADATGRDETFVGRVHIDPENPNTLKFWVVSDNLRKGAALNGIQIAETLFDNR